MKLTRRAALVGTAASLAVVRIAHAVPRIEPSVPRSPAPPPVSPFLPIQWGPVGWIMQFTSLDRSQVMDSEYRRLSLGFTRPTGIPVSSVDDAENIYLECAHVADEVKDLRWHNHLSRPQWMGCAIRRQASYVGQRGRRGYGHIALMHPAMIEQIDPVSLVAPEHVQGAQIGRWTRTGEMHGGITIWCSPHLPMNQAYMVYSRGWMDAGGILLHNDNGLALAMQKVGDMTGPQQYATRVRFLS